MKDAPWAIVDLCYIWCKLKNLLIPVFLKIISLLPLQNENSDQRNKLRMGTFEVLKKPKELMKLFS